MALLKIKNEYLKLLRKAKEEEKLSFFIGSGFSSSKDTSKYGGWGTIVKKLKAELSTELENENDYLKIAQIYEATKGRNNLLAVVKKTFPDIDESDELHETLIKCNVSNIITTNWDCLIETAAKKNLSIYDTIANDSELLKSTHQNKIVKIHGDFAHNNIVFSEQDYLNYSDLFPIVENYVKNIVATNTIVLLGYSFSDLDLKQIVNWVIKKTFKKPSIFMITTELKASEEILYFEKSFGIKTIQICEDINESKEAFINFFKNLDYEKHIEELETPEAYVYRHLKQYEKYPVILRRFIQKSLTNCSYAYNSSQETILVLNQKIITIDTDNEKRDVLKKFYDTIPYLLKEQNKTLFKIVKILNKADVQGIITDEELFGSGNFIRLSKTVGNKDFYNENFDFAYDISDTFSIKNKMRTIFSLNALERYEEAYKLNQELLAETRYQEDFANYFIGLLNNNSILFVLKYSLQCGIETNKKYRTVSEISIIDEFIKLSPVQHKQFNQIFEYASLTTITTILSNMRNELKKIKERKAVVAQDGVAYSEESGHRTNHKNFVDFVVNSGICIENNSLYIECCHNYIEMFFENTLSTIYYPNKTELYSLIRYYKNEELKKLLCAFEKRDSKYKIIVDARLHNWLIYKVLENCVDNYINKNNPFTELEKFIDNTIYILSLIKNTKKQTEKILNQIKKVISNARNSQTIFSIIDLFFVNQYVLYKGTFLKGIPAIEVFETIVQKLVENKCNLHEIHALLSYKFLNICNIGIQKSVKFTNGELLKKLLAKINEMQNQSDKYRYVEHLVMVIYQMSNETCKSIIKDFINNWDITKDKTAIEYLSFMLTLKQLKFDIDDSKLRMFITNYINSIPTNSFTSAFYTLRAKLDTVCKNDLSYKHLEKQVDTKIADFEKAGKEIFK